MLLYVRVILDLMYYVTLVTSHWLDLLHVADLLGVYAHLLNMPS